MKKKLAIMLGVLTMVSMTACTINIGESGTVEIKDSGLTVSGNLDGEVVTGTTDKEEEPEVVEDTQEEKETAPEATEETDLEEEQEEDTEEGDSDEEDVETEEDDTDEVDEEEEDGDEEEEAEDEEDAEDEVAEVEADAEEMISAIPYDAYKNCVYVTSTELLVESIAPDTLLVLAPGVYDITRYVESAEEIANKKVKYDADEGLQINSVNNFAIYAENPARLTQIVVEDAYADVLQFNKCKNITLSGIVMGHAVEPGYCTGAVLGLISTNNVVLNNMNLYGCGTYGIEAEKCNSITVNDSWIHDCSYGIVCFTAVKNAIFNNCTMSYCQEFTLLDFNKSAAVFNNCLFAYNYGQAMLSKSGTYTFNGCTFMGSETEEGIEGMKVTMDDDCIFGEDDSSMSVG